LVLGTLVPVVGHLAGGGQAMADRYMYIPSIGISFVRLGISQAAFGMAIWSPRLIAITMLNADSICRCTRAQVRHWHNSRTLLDHALAVYTKNAVVHYLWASTTPKTKHRDSP